jgi:predicted nucleic acid-binding protein
MIVVDASTLLEVLLMTEAGGSIRGRLFRKGETLHAPHLIDLEIAQVLRRYGQSGDLDASRGAEALEDLADFPLSRYPHDFLLPRIWDLRTTITAYDAAYVALAEVLGARLLTREKRLAAAAAGSIKVEVI